MLTIDREIGDYTWNDLMEEIRDTIEMMGVHLCFTFNVKEGVLYIDYDSEYDLELRWIGPLTDNQYAREFFNLGNHLQAVQAIDSGNVHIARFNGPREPDDMNINGVPF